MDLIITKINKIQDIFRGLHEDPIELPQIVVVGMQSSGKSSVLESLVQRSFLPRGSGIVTRCPIILQLQHCPREDRRRKEKGTENIEEWGEFLHDHEKIYSIQEIQDAIEMQTTLLAGSEKNITDEPITLKIFSPKVLTLTLVDLPGLVKVPVAGQPADIESITREMINKYIQNPLSIILAVVAANVDMATNESLLLAREADPKGDRTLVVVTKLDIMDKGTDAYDVLTGRLIPVKLGIIGIVSRSQADINKNKSIEDCIKDEEKFLEENYPDLCAVNGSKFLAQMLQKLLMNHIKKCVPEMQMKIRQHINEAEKFLRQREEVKDDMTSLIQIISEFSETFIAMLEAAYLDIKSPELIGGAKICHIFQQLSNVLLHDDPTKAYSLEEVLMAIRNSNGPRPPFLVSEPAFEALVKPLIRNTEKHLLTCLEDVVAELGEVCNRSLPEVVLRFPNMRTEIISVVNSSIEDGSKLTRDLILHSLEIEHNHISYGPFNEWKDDMIKKFHVAVKIEGQGVEHHDSDDYPDYPENPPHNTYTQTCISEIPFEKSGTMGMIDPELLKMTPGDVEHVVILGKMLQFYYALVSKKLADTVSKTIMTYLVCRIKKVINLKLACNLMKEEIISNLFVEQPLIVSERKDTIKKLKVLKESLKILASVVE